MTLRKFDYLKRKAEVYERTLNSKMELRRAEALRGLSERDAILYYPDGYLGNCEVQRVEFVGISSLQVAGKPFDLTSGVLLMSRLAQKGEG